MKKYILSHKEKQIEFNIKGENIFEELVQLFNNQIQKHEFLTFIEASIDYPISKIYNKSDKSEQEFAYIPILNTLFYFDSNNQGARICTEEGFKSFILNILYCFCDNKNHSRNLLKYIDRLKSFDNIKYTTINEFEEY